MKNKEVFKGLTVLIICGLLIELFIRLSWSVTTVVEVKTDTLYIVDTIIKIVPEFMCDSPEGYIVCPEPLALKD